MRTFSFRTIALGALAGVLVAAGAYAADTPPAPKTGQHQHGAWLQQKLGLTDVQVQQIRDIRTRDFANQKQNWQALRQAQGELRRLALAGADDATLAAKQTEVQTLLGQSMQARVSALREIGPILTPEQRDAFAKIMDHGPRHHHRHSKPSAAPAQPGS